MLRLTVDASGKISDVTVVTSSGREALDAAAVRAAWLWQLLPALAEGTAVAATLDKTVEFRLTEN